MSSAIPSMIIITPIPTIPNAVIPPAGPAIRRISPLPSNKPIPIVPLMTINYYERFLEFAGLTRKERLTNIWYDRSSRLYSPSSAMCYRNTKAWLLCKKEAIIKVETDLTFLFSGN